MSFRDEDIATLIASPSLGAITYQACALVEELEGIKDHHYPSEACRIRDVLLCVADHVRNELWGMYDPNSPLTAKDDLDYKRTRLLGGVLRELYSNLRYLKASTPNRSPIAIQQSLARLTELYFPRAQNGEGVCLIRPQWRYNLKFVRMSENLTCLLDVAYLDPEGNLAATRKAEILPALWERWIGSRPTSDANATRRQLPKHFAVLSFAGLDTHDTLLYPLLAHELGHFIIASYEPELHLHEGWRLGDSLTEQKVRIALESDGQSVGLPLISETQVMLVERAQNCMRELLADLLAVRMMGFSFFMAQAEFLKTVTHWQEPSITQGDYPGIRLRLSVVLDYLLNEDTTGNLKRFLAAPEFRTNHQAAWLLRLLERWQKFLEESPNRSMRTSVEEHLDNLVSEAVVESIEWLRETARNVIPDEIAAHLSPKFFERIKLMENVKAPSFLDDDPRALAEIMSAAWGYQLIYGEEREIQHSEIHGQFGEYKRTCGLCLEALESVLNASS